MLRKKNLQRILLNELNEFIDRHIHTPTENRQTPNVRTILVPKILKEKSEIKFSKRLKYPVTG